MEITVNEKFESSQESTLQELDIQNLLNLEQTFAKDLLQSVQYSWEAIPLIKEYIILSRERLISEGYEEIGENIWVGEGICINEISQIEGPLIIGRNSKIGFCANIRGGIIGENCEIGDSEIKNSILFNGVKVPHKSYVGDSLLGHMAHLGCGTSCMNLKSIKSPVSIKFFDKKINTGLRKFGSILGDFVDIGGNSTLNPGTVVGRNTTIYSGSLLSGYVPGNSICKTKSSIEIVEKI